MTKMEMVSRYTDLARQRSELFLQSGSGWNADIERQEKAILGEMAALEAAIKHIYMFVFMLFFTTFFYNAVNKLNNFFIDRKSTRLNSSH